MSRWVAALVVALIVTLLFVGAVASGSFAPTVSNTADDDPVRDPQQVPTAREETPPTGVSIESAEVEVLPERCGDVPVSVQRMQDAVKVYVRNNAASLPAKHVARSLVVVACIYPSARFGLAADAAEAIVVFPQPADPTAIQLPPECRPPQASPTPDVVVPVSPDCTLPPMPQQSAPAVSVKLDLAGIR